MTLLLYSLFNVCFFSDLQCQIMKNNPALGVEKSGQIARHVSFYADKYGFSEKVFAAILMQESAYKLNAKGCNKYGCDYGISQIHHRTAEAYGFDTKRLVTDLRYSIEAGAIVLAWFYDTYEDEEPNRWWNRYNCGTRKSIKRDTCQEYDRLVRRWM